MARSIRLGASTPCLADAFGLATGSELGGRCSLNAAMALTVPSPLVRFPGQTQQGSRRGLGIVFILIWRCQREGCADVSPR
jgi:hypothetical protein